MPRPTKTSVRKLLDDYGRNQLAAALNVSRETISRWYENGAIPLHRLERAAKVLQCDPIDLNPHVAKVASISSHYNMDSPQGK